MCKIFLGVTLLFFHRTTKPTAFVATVETTVGTAHGSAIETTVGAADIAPIDTAFVKSYTAIGTAL